MAHEFNIKNGFITSGQSYVYNNLIVTGLTLSSIPANDDTLTQILARDSSGNVKYRNASSLGGGSSTFTGGTVSGATIFTGGLSANTISATTYYNLPSQVAGSQYQIQYNNGSTFAADGYLTWDYGVYSMRVGTGHSILNPNESSIIAGTSNTLNNGPNTSAFRYNNIFGGQQNTQQISNAQIFDTNTIVGGIQNTIQELYNSLSVINNGVFAGNNNNLYDATSSVIVGGQSNSISNNAGGNAIFTSNSILGGATNSISNLHPSTPFANNTIIGGLTNDITEFGSPTSVYFNTVVGGDDNHIKDANNSIVLGGETNQIYGQQGVAIFGGAVVGGDSNQIYNTNPGVTMPGNIILGGSAGQIVEGSSHITEHNIIGGGSGNQINDARTSIIFGGTSNTILRVTSSSMSHNGIFGGSTNSIYDGTGSVGVDSNTILGGDTNHIYDKNGTSPVTYNSIVGGQNHQIWDTYNSAIIGGSNNLISNVVTRSVIIGGQNNTITNNVQEVVILGGTGITITQSNTTYVQNFNINTPPVNDNSLTQVLVRDGVTGNVNYRDASTFGGGSVVQGITAITASNGISASTTSYGTVLGFSGGAISSATRFTNGLTANTISATTYSNLPVTGLTQGSNITITPNGVGGFTIASTGGGSGTFTGGTVSGGTNFISGVTANTLVYSVVTLSSGATIAVNATLGNEFKVTLGGNSVLGNPTGAVDGQYLRFAIRQDGTGARNLTFDTKYRFGNEIGTPSVDLTANKTSYLGIRYNAADDKFDVVSFVSGY